MTLCSVSSKVQPTSQPGDLQLSQSESSILNTLQSRDYHGYLEGKRRQDGDEQRPARGNRSLADFQYNQSII